MKPDKITTHGLLEVCELISGTRTKVTDGPLLKLRRKIMNKRQRKKKILNGLNKEERYCRTHCPVCDSKIGVFDEYFNSYGFCCVACGYEYYGIKR